MCHNARLVGVSVQGSYQLLHGLDGGTGRRGIFIGCSLVQNGPLEESVERLLLSSHGGDLCIEGKG